MATYRASATAVSTSANTLTVDKPTGTVNGDVLFALAYVNSSSVTITPPAGWNIIDTINTTITAKMTLYYKVASSEGANYRFDFSATTRVRVSIHAYYRADTIAPINAHSVKGNAAGANAVATGITSTVANSQIIFFAGMDSGLSVTFTPDGSLTERYDSGGVAAHEVADALQVTPGATGDKTAVPSDKTDENAAFLLALSPITAGQNTETDLAQAIAKQKAKVIGQNTEADEAQAVAKQKAKVIGQNTETDLAQAVAKQKAKVIGQNTETDLEQAVGRIKVMGVAQVTEADEAQRITRFAGLILQQVEENDLAQAIMPMKRMMVGQAVEFDLTQAMVSMKRVMIRQAIEIDLAGFLSRKHEPPMSWKLEEGQGVSQLVHSRAHQLVDAHVDRLIEPSRPRRLVKTR